MSSCFFNAIIRGLVDSTVCRSDYNYSRFDFIIAHHSTIDIHFFIGISRPAIINKANYIRQQKKVGQKKGQTSTSGELDTCNRSDRKISQVRKV
ncbi:hypothetical protein C0Q70_18344 [Pomacea canaliculata]|uniref:Uncharacterized protein n=1 Tax=Pomacea canaliculata TaxID=400727 RepID=A0A2T7NMY5_POMCA|nr:hypothetical protein C0Q70_18344 [Pomacea canaliculata]